MTNREWGALTFGDLTAKEWAMGLTNMFMLVGFLGFLCALGVTTPGRKARNERRTEIRTECLDAMAQRPEVLEWQAHRICGNKSRALDAAMQAKS